MDTQIYFFPGNNQPEQVAVASVGGKAQSLIRMVELQLPVPHGFVLTTSFFDSWFAQIKRGQAWQSFLAANSDVELKSACDELKDEAKALSLSVEQKQIIAEALEKFTHERELFAVRSSSPEEDLEGSSFAGGYETILGVNKNGIEEAIKKAFASCLDQRVVVYKKQHGFDFRSPKIAVVIQKQIASDVAGVGFSLNPITNSYDEAVITSNWGLGETVVAGIATPDTFIVDKIKMSILQKSIGEKETSIWLKPDGGTEEHADLRHAESSLTDDQILQLAQLIGQVESSYGRPMDIEWAFANGEMFLLQARPITTFVPLANELVTVPGSQKRLYADVTICVQGLYKPLSVLGTSFLKRAASQLTSKVLGQDITKSIDNSFVYIGNGRIYANISNLFEFAGQEKILKFFENVDPLTAQIIGSVSEEEYRSHNPNIKNLPLHLFFQVTTFGLHVLEARFLPEHAQRHVVQEVKAFKQEVHRLTAEPLPLVGFVDALGDRLRIAVLSAVAPAFATSRIALERMKAIAAGESFVDDFKSLERGLPHNPTTEMGLALYSMAQLLPTEMSAAEIASRLAARDLPKPFLDAWDEFLVLYGHRGPTELDMAAPRFRDDPSTLVAQIATLRKSASAEDNPQERFDKGQMMRAEAFNRIGERLHNRGWGTLNTFSALYRVYETLAGYREMPKYLLIYCLDAVRTRALTLGEQLAANGRLDDAKQVFDLTLQQLEAAPSDKTMDLRAIASDNKVIINQLNLVATLPTVIDSRGKIISLPPVEAKDGEIVGTPVSSGVARGPIKVLHSPDEKPLERGDVLVARATDPGWTPLFVNASAVILEVGGMLQHGALVAREYGLPCVTGISNATTLWQDGTMVEVDGSSGRIRLIEQTK
ncbi:MAG TPA: PEP/pyruvate-binding domain-containing protein [Planktothrix sp.]|jgi:pyruvate,water dikinase